MVDALSIGLSGLLASRLRAITHANNLANLNTPGYKTQQPVTATGPAGDSARISAVGRNYSQGPIRPTGNPLDVAIDGPGFFQVQGPGGTVLFTRAGNFQVSSDGNLVTAGGLTLLPPIAIPPGAQVSVASDGIVSAQVGHAPPQQVGRIQLARFNNPEGLALAGDGLAAETPASGPPIVTPPGTGEAGRLISGFLETSNVDITSEIVALKMETRIYAANARVVRAADETNRESLDLLA